MTDVERFWSKVDRSGDCWVWKGAVKKDRRSGGYGMFWSQNRTRRAHKFAYEHAVGPVPPGLELDHLCGNRACVNPAHLEPVTGRVNALRSTGITARNARKTACVRGHGFTSSNTRVRKNGDRVCRKCSHLHRQRWRARTMAKAPENQALQRGEGKQ